MPKVSIIVPIYNVEKYLYKCIDSILDQTFSDFELLLVNDGSPDTCGEICNEYAKKDKRIKVIHKENGGLADARNAGLDIATGEYIGFVDSDDFIESDMYEKLLNACMLNEASISMCGRYNVFENELKPLFSFNGIKVWNSKEAIERLLTWDNIDSSACDKLFKKDLFHNIRFPVGKYNEDIFVMTKILSKANKIVHIGVSKYYYYHRTNSITTETFSEKKMDLIDASKKVLDFVIEKYPDVRSKAVSFHLKGIIHLVRILQSNELKTKYPYAYEKLNELLRQNMFSIITSKYIDFKRKIISVLMVTNTFEIFRKIYKLKSNN
jgi:glycosyltransferase involved in cell wall biosynthesis